jgi:hypothetical protein
MVNPSRLMEALPGPGKAHRFINQVIMPLAIAWATTVENGGYQAGQTVRKYPGKSAICALVFGFALAVVRAKFRLEAAASRDA